MPEAITFPSRDWFRLLAAAMRADRELGVTGHGLSLDLGLRCGEDTYLLRLRGGHLTVVEPVRSDPEDVPELIICTPLNGATAASTSVELVMSLILGVGQYADIVLAEPG